MSLSSLPVIGFFEFLEIYLLCVSDMESGVEQGLKPRHVSLGM